MKILGMGVPELLIILVVILLIFGPKNLPKLGSALGKTVKNLREGMGAGEKDVEEAADDEEVVCFLFRPDARLAPGLGVTPSVGGGAGGAPPPPPPPMYKRENRNHHG